MNEVDILSQIYNAITTAPTILTPAFIEQLLTQILPLAESNADNDTVENAINALYQQFTKVRDEIKILNTKNLDGAEAKVTPGRETLINTYPDIKKLEASLKTRIDKANAKQN
jgi:division protein CdvB (Snf7/Vps24/ESCRT-III family)